MKKIYVVGIGAGNYDGMTVGAVRTLEKVDVIVGYTVYIDLIKPFFAAKTFISTPMMKETERCRIALEKAAEGKTVAMICSGDAGIYGMASPILELAEEYGVETEIIAGVTAASSGAALLGSPITCDFAVISLSDLLTPYETIINRVENIAKADMCMVIYNPSSRKRSDYMQRVCEIILKYRSSSTVCGICRNIGRDGQDYEITTLSELTTKEIDMFTTVFIGNSTTKVVDGRMVTPRGYSYEK